MADFDGQIEHDRRVSCLEAARAGTRVDECRRPICAYSITVNISHQGHKTNIQNHRREK